jgi:hypothetical protein
MVIEGMQMVEWMQHGLAESFKLVKNSISKNFIG